MDYRVFVLCLRALLAAITATLSGLLLWLLGSVTVVPFIPHNAVVVIANLVIGLGVGAGVAAWLIGLQLGSNRTLSRRELLACVLLSIVCAWLGLVVLSRTLFVNVDAVRVKTTNEVYGALAGAVGGAVATPLILGAWRIVRREEP